MPIRSIHAPTLLVSQRVWGRSPGPKLRRSVELAQEVGASTVVVHPPFRWQYRYAREFEDLVGELDEAEGVTIAVENMYPWRSRKREMQAYLPGWDPSEHGYEHVTLDLSHAAVAQQDALALLDVFDGRLAHVHLADGSSSITDEHLVPGRGDQPCDLVLAELVRRGWEGDVVVEISTRRARTAAERREDLAASLFFARTYLTPGPHPGYSPPPGPPHRHVDAWGEAEAREIAAAEDAAGSAGPADGGASEPERAEDPAQRLEPRVVSGQRDHQHEVLSAVRAVDPDVRAELDIPSSAQNGPWDRSSSAKSAPGTSIRCPCHPSPE